MTDKRKCEICFSKQSAILHKQQFEVVNQKKGMYKILCCKKCGFLFASNLPLKENIEKFYKKNVKYAFIYDQGDIPEFAHESHLSTFNYIDHFLKNNSIKKDSLRVLDIGCATGELLNLFKINNYKNIKGVDPARECRLIAKKKYKINVETSTISEFNSKTQYNLIIISSVLEHLENLDKQIIKISKLISNKGYLSITVPDVSKFDKKIREPYLEFSTEHINYFTKNSLSNLLNQYGFKNKSFFSHRLKGFDGYALESIWQFSGKTKEIKKDLTGKEKMVSYIKLSQKIQKKYEQKINLLLKDGDEIIIWGMGSLTSRLLATTNLSKLKIIKIVDSNPKLQNKKIKGLVISDPESIKGLKKSILICTVNYQKEIKNILSKKYKYAGNIISF